MGWIGKQPKSIEEVSPGEYELCFHSAEALEALLALNGRRITEGGIRLKVELSPQLLNLGDIVEHISETLESQPDGPQKRVSIFLIICGCFYYTIDGLRFTCSFF